MRAAKSLVQLLVLGGTCALAACSGGCFWDSWAIVKGPPAPPGAADSLVLRGDRLEAEAPPAAGSVAAELAGAHDLFRKSDYETAEKVFHRIAENTKNSPQTAEQARFYEAECLRRQAKYPRAADTYTKMLNDFPSGAHREQAIYWKFQIGNYWLDDTREEARELKEKTDGKRWYVYTGPEFHWEKSKPFFDEEGRAIEQLEQVTYNDTSGKLVDQALFLAGSVKFYRQDYREADHYFTQIVEKHPNSKFYAQAIELAIISKQMSTGGSDYDGRKVAEARQLVDTALRTCPELAAKKNEFLDKLRGINYQQADKDIKIAEFYQRTGHPGSAYFYYEIVRRRYPGTPYFDRATERMYELRGKLEKEQAKKAAPIAPPKAENLLPPEPAGAPQRLPDLGQQPQNLAGAH